MFICPRSRVAPPRQCVSIGEAAAILGVSVVTLRRWEHSGRLIPCFRTEGGHRRYQLHRLLARRGEAEDERPEGLTLCYARVSSHDQKEDLQRQKARLRDYCESRGLGAVQVIEDLGSGLNYKKRGLRSLLRLLMSGQVRRLVVTYKDRLLRFGSELIFSLCEHQGIEVTVLEAPDEQSAEARLCADVIELMTVFSARLYGARGHRKRRMAA